VEHVPISDVSNGRPYSPETWDPHFLQTEFEMIQSTAVLGRVVEKLNLDVEWGKKYNGGTTLKTAETIEFLKKRLDLCPVRTTSLIEIRVFSEDGREAARLANAVAEAYRDYRLERRQQVSVGANAAWAVSTEIVAPAVPSLTPALPNKPRNIALGAVAGILLASVAGAISAFITFQIRKRMCKTTPAA
jgi:uncharacterized protein involved in exopolysaccharide biosynthesis